jgi:hypothetical protein
MKEHNASIFSVENHTKQSSSKEGKFDTLCLRVLFTLGL